MAISSFIFNVETSTLEFVACLDYHGYHGNHGNWNAGFWLV